MDCGLDTGSGVRVSTGVRDLGVGRPLVSVAQTCYCGSACGVEDLLAVGEVEVVALGGEDAEGVFVEGAVENVGGY